MKELGYRIFAVLYRIFCIFPVDKRRVFLVMTHDSGAEGNVAVVRDYMRRLDAGYRFAQLKREDTHFGKSIAKLWRFFVVDAYCLARSKYVFLDNMFLPMAYLTFRPQVKVVQLWHGTGVIKKIGAHVNEGRLKELERKANQNNTHLIVSSDTTKRIYKESFSMPSERVYVTGMPRADVFFDDAYKAQARPRLEGAYPQLAGKRLILYAPTFRDTSVAHPKLALDVSRLARQLPNDCVLGLRLHPFVARAFEREHAGQFGERVLDFSLYPSLNTLLCATDLLISDYSSIVFEYAALERPMAFYAYDLAAFAQDGRGFYWDYESYVPGPVVRSEEELTAVVGELLAMDAQAFAERYHLQEFVESTYAYRDSHAMERLAKLLALG
jgi:CDP-ribitol ribitolphosphotransferase